MPVDQRASERISELTIRARAINQDTTVLRQKWSACFDDDHDRGWRLLAEMSDLTGQALTIRRTLENLHESGAPNPTVSPETRRSGHHSDRSQFELHAQSQRAAQRADDTATVSVMSRQRIAEGESSRLIVGVFPSAADAMLFALMNESVAIDEWERPRPGRRYWLRPGALVSFTIEEHAVWQSSIWPSNGLPLECPNEHAVATAH
jgi:hypothetical protein